MSYGIIVNGNLTYTSTSVTHLSLATQGVPSSLSGVLALPTESLEWEAGKLNPLFEDYGCPLVRKWMDGVLVTVFAGMMALGKLTRSLEKSNVVSSRYKCREN